VFLLDFIRFEIITQTTIGISAVLNFINAFGRLKEVVDIDND
jgi:hypothetical protein